MDLVYESTVVEWQAQYLYRGFILSKGTPMSCVKRSSFANDTNGVL